VLPLIHCVCMPSPLPRQVRWNRFAQDCSIDFGHPHITDRSAPALSVSWPAQRSLTLRPTDSPSRLRDPLHRRLRRLCCLHRPSDCYRVERSSSRAGLSSRCGPALFTAHRYGLIATVGRDDRSWPTRGEMQARFARGADSSDDTSEVYAGSSGHSG
jgi:hypothetical protein